MVPEMRQIVIGELIAFFPFDVVIEILIRLPIKSLLKFRCVAKSWNSLISSHEFCKSHLQYSNLRDKVLLLRNRDGVFFKQLSLYEQLLFIQPPVEFRGYLSVEFVGSCNGLVCVAARKCFSGVDIYVWNPSTRKIKRLPSFDYDERRYFYAFGFDESCDDYKVVASNFSDEGLLVKIFSLKSGEFKRIINDFGLGAVVTPPSFANGKLHWFAEETITGGAHVVAYLDLTTEEYGVLDKPDFLELCWYNSITKEISGRSFYIISYNASVDDEDHTDVWLVEPGYGIGETTWTKVHSIPGFTAYSWLHGLLYMLENGEIVFVGRQIGIYNPSDHSVTFLEFGGSTCFHGGITYVESLVSPFP